jgi:hypothetical protein
MSSQRSLSSRQSNQLAGLPIIWRPSGSTPVPSTSASGLPPVSASASEPPPVAFTLNPSISPTDDPSFSYNPAATPPPLIPLDSPTPFQDPFQDETDVYAVQGSGSALVTYAVSGGTQQETVRLPWSKTLAAPLPQYPILWAQHTVGSGPITCSIALTGGGTADSVAQATSSGAYAVVTCSPPSGG